ncbi:hypothetical protein F8G81_20290 [Arthrobacter sp. CDRTa11]|nr:hypothetical protein F8G81_20290 [Arthrobacter sp. CDRTa11]
MPVPKKPGQLRYAEARWKPNDLTEMVMTAFFIVTLGGFFCIFGQPDLHKTKTEKFMVRFMQNARLSFSAGRCVVVVTGD